jgi:PHD/YefM family antitoxin component YafN of YafNO toxin-antitoxin module
MNISLMPKIPNIIPVTDLRQDATIIVKRVAASREPLFIAQGSKAAAVMVRMEAYDNSRHGLELLRILARGEKEIEADKGYDLGGVSAEPDSLSKGKEH